MASFTDERGLRRSKRKAAALLSPSEEPQNFAKHSVQLPPTPLSTAVTNASPSSTHSTSPAIITTSSRSNTPLSELASEDEAQLRKAFEQEFPHHLSPNSNGHNDDQTSMMLRDKRSTKRPDVFGMNEDAADAYFASEDPDAMDVDEAREETPPLPSRKRAVARPKATKTAQTGQITKKTPKGSAKKATTTAKKTANKAATTVKKTSTKADSTGRIAKMSKIVKLTLTPSQLQAIIDGVDVVNAVKDAPPTPESPPVPTVDFLKDVDPALLTLSTQLTYRVAVADKPFARAEPPVHAVSRQSLCETVSYFHSQYSGVHTRDGIIYGSLFDGTPACREYMDSNVIIARASGKMGVDEKKMIQTKNHSMSDANTQAALNNMKLHNPVVLIIGSDSEASQCQYQYRYCVLGWYKLVDVWEEKVKAKGDDTVISIRYRYERLAAKEAAWHAPEVDDIVEAAKSHSPLLHTETCQSCDRTWKQMYLEGWMCLNSQCDRFWKIDGHEAPNDVLHYNPAYLFHRTSWGVEIDPYPVKHPLPELNKCLGDHLAYINTRGIVCPECGRCNPRFRFDGWTCNNAKCSWPGLFTTAHPITRQTLHQPWERIGGGPSLVLNKQAKSTLLEIKYVAGYKVAIYTWEGIEGRLVHATANAGINKEAGGPDDMFHELQTKDIGLQRRRFAAQRLAGKNVIGSSKKVIDEEEDDGDDNMEASMLERDDQGPTGGQPDLRDLMGAFTMNFGMPYKFVASGMSKSFEEAPEVIKQARSRLSWAANAMLGPPTPTTTPSTDNHETEDAEEKGVGETITVADNRNRIPKTEFNELLILAYFESQKINYHDDGEEGLGPRIATLSLGAKAKMSLRLKQKHWQGYTKTGYLVEDRPVALCAGDYEMRLACWEEVQSLRHDRKQQMEASKRLAAGLKNIKGFTAKAHPLLEITLSHGDVVLMEGYDVQRYLEHAVEPVGHLRFALTCRDVLPGHLKESEKPAYEVGPDRIGYAGPVVDGMSEEM